MQYRMYRNSVREKAIADYLRKRDEAFNTRSDYEWDTCMRLGKMSDSEIKISPEEFKEKTHLNLDHLLCVTRIMATLPDDAKQRAYAGEIFQGEGKISLRILLSLSEVIFGMCGMSIREVLRRQPKTAKDLIR